MERLVVVAVRVAVRVTVSVAVVVVVVGMVVRVAVRVAVAEMTVRVLSLRSAEVKYQTHSVTTLALRAHTMVTHTILNGTRTAIQYISSILYQLQVRSLDWRTRARVQEALNGFGLWDRVNLVVVSEHGLTSISDDRFAFMDEWTSPDHIEKVVLLHSHAWIKSNPQHKHQVRVLPTACGDDITL